MLPPHRSLTSSKPTGGDGGGGGCLSGAISRTNATPHRISAAAYSSNLNICTLRRCASSSARSRAASASSLDRSSAPTRLLNESASRSKASTRRSDVLSARANNQPIHDATAANAAPTSSAGNGGRSRSCMRPVWAAKKSGDTHASGACIIGMTRFPPPPSGMFAITVLFGHTSTVAPSDEPSVFRSG